MICSPMRWTGFSDVIGSWKIIAISSPRSRRSSSSLAVRTRSSPTRAIPSNVVFTFGVRPMRVIADTDLPEPDSPDDREHLAGVQLERHVVDGLHDAVLRAEPDAQVLHVEQDRVAS